MTDRSVFSKTNQIFENCKFSSLIQHDIQFPQAERLIRLSSRFFQILDRADAAQSEISRRLWVLKSSIIFTILPFDDPSLELLHQLRELEKVAECMPDAFEMMTSLSQSVTDIVSGGRNPKREWFIRTYFEDLVEADRLIGVLTRLSAGRSPGWPQDKPDLLAALNPNLVPIRSKKDLHASQLNSVTLPCACSNVHQSLMREIFFTGLVSQIDILLYPGERFQMPQRFVLPKDTIFSSRLQKSRMEISSVEEPSDHLLAAVDTWMNEAFWQGLHGAERNILRDLIPARYILFRDGTGAFFPEDGRLTMLPLDGKLKSENDLCFVRLKDISEGERVVLRSGGSGWLLDDASERIAGGVDHDRLFERATDWKASLEALLITYSGEEVSLALRERGVTASASSIVNWAGSDVLGPGNEKAFNELIFLLSEKGKIQKNGSEIVSYAEACWQSLQELRGLHQKAGNLIRQDLFKALFSRFGNEGKSAELLDRESISIQSDSDAQLLVLRVAAVDSSTAYVSSSRLGKIEQLEGNKWLG